VQNTAALLNTTNANTTTVASTSKTTQTHTSAHRSNKQKSTASSSSSRDMSYNVLGNPGNSFAFANSGLDRARADEILASLLNAI
jgi:hypothetical protein